MSGPLRLLGQATEKATDEIARAASAIFVGCPEGEAMGSLIGDGPEDSMHEFFAYLKKSNNEGRSILIARAVDGSFPAMTFRLGNQGRILMPLARDLVCEAGIARNAPDKSLASDKDERKRRENLKDAGSNAVALVHGTKEVLVQSKLSHIFAPQVPNGLTFSNPALMCSLVTLGVICAAKKLMGKK